MLVYSVDGDIYYIQVPDEPVSFVDISPEVPIDESIPCQTRTKNNAYATKTIEQKENETPNATKNQCNQS